MLPPGPREPAALQTVEWIVRPTALLRRAAARYGEPFTLRTAWSDAPLVLTSDPEEIKRVYRAPPDVLEGGDSSAFLEPFVGPQLDPDPARATQHLRQRRQMLPPFHGDALKRWTDTIAEIAHAELDTWVPGRPLKALPRMQALTLEVIQRVIFGSRDPELRDALRAALDMTGSTWRLIAMSLVQGRAAVPTLHARGRAHRRADLRPDRHAPATATRSSTCSPARGGEARPARHAARRRPRDDGDRAGVGAGAAGATSHRAATPTSRSTRSSRRSCARGPCSRITARRVLQPYTLGDYTLPPGVYVAPCIYLAHRRADTFIPFGGGVRRCLGAAFATLEMREVLRAVAARFTLRPERAEGERMRRRSVTLAPARGASIIP